MFRGFDVPFAPSNLLISLESLGSNPTLSAILSISYRPRNHPEISWPAKVGHPGNLRIRLGHLVGDHVAIHVERRANIRMPHEFLLHGNRSSRGVQPRPIAVTEGMRPKPRD